MVNKERLVANFKTMCEINAPALAERPCIDWGLDYLRGLGFSPREDNAGDKIGGNAGNIICEVPGKLSSAPRIFLSAHWDTVEPTEGLTIIEDDGVLKSDGTTILGADDKGGMAPILEAVQSLQEAGEEHGDIVLLLTVAEEIGLKGAAACDVSDLGLDYGYVLDTGPPVGSFVNRTAYHDSIQVRIVGRPAHAGKFPEQGINAIMVAADALSNMKMGRIGPETTSNFGIISGGTGVNVVCPFVDLKGEVRSTSLSDLEQQVDHMTSAFQRAGEQWGAEVQIVHDRHYSAYEIDAEHRCVAAAQRAASTLGFDGKLRTTLGGSDANVFNQKGVPSIVVATGMKDIHTHQEHIAIEDMVKTTELTIELIREAARMTN